jgi:hypothetical protein
VSVLVVSSIGVAKGMCYYRLRDYRVFSHLNARPQRLHQIHAQLSLNCLLNHAHGFLIRANNPKLEELFLQLRVSLCFPFLFYGVLHSSKPCGHSTLVNLRVGHALVTYLEC